MFFQITKVLKFAVEKQKIRTNLNFSIKKDKILLQKIAANK